MANANPEALLLRNMKNIEREDKINACVTMFEAWRKTGDFGYLARCRDHMEWIYNEYLKQAGVMTHASKA